MPRMLFRILSVLAMIATVIAAIYTVSSYYRSPSLTARSEDIGSQNPPPLNDRNSVTAPSRIERRSAGNNSPNVVSGGSVSIQIKP